MLTKRLSIGTVQMGLPYGIANKNGQILLAEARKILDHAWSQGVDTLDTAVSYGVSEELLGQVGVEAWSVVTKLPAIPVVGGTIKAWMYATLTASLSKLNLSRVNTLLLHSPEQLLGPDGDVIYEALIDLKSQGLAQRIGYSIYNPEVLAKLCDNFPPDLIQAPVSIVDRTLITSGWLERLSQKGIVVHARSIFLQGLLLMEIGERPPLFQRWEPLWLRWHAWLNQNRISPLQACLGFVLAQPQIEKVILGVDNDEQLREILATLPLPAEDIPVDISCDDPLLIYPQNWSQL